VVNFSIIPPWKDLDGIYEVVLPVRHRVFPIAVPRYDPVQPILTRGMAYPALIPWRLAYLSRLINFPPVNHPTRAVLDQG
jgi:phage terminase large subunit-like protein